MSAKESARCQGPNITDGVTLDHLMTGNHRKVRLEGNIEQLKLTRYRTSWMGDYP